MRFFSIHKRKEGGYTLVEMLIYVSILATVMVFVVKTLLAMSQAYTSLVASRALNNSAITALERLTREIRWSSNVDSTGSTLDVNPSTLTLVYGTSTTRFYVANNALRVDYNGVPEGPLTTGGVKVTKFTVNQLSAVSSNAVRVDMVLTAGAGSAAKSAEFYVTVGMRGSY